MENSGDRENELHAVQTRIVHLEECVAHQDHLLAQLNDVILDMRSEFDRIRLQIERETARLESFIETRLGDNHPDEKPPHY